MVNPLDFIKIISNSFHGAEHVYTKGSCYQLYKILKPMYPQAEAWSDDDHVITKIGNGFYDITGEVDPRGFSPVVRHGHYEKWKFDFWSCGLECPQCDEMVCYSGLIHKQQKINYNWKEDQYAEN